MSVATAFVSGNRMRLKIDAIDHYCDLTGFEEIKEEIGGVSVQTACGFIRVPPTSVIVGCKMTMVQNLEEDELFEFLRTNVSDGTEVLSWTFGASYTQAATNPLYTATLTGWTKPVAKWSAGSGAPTTEAEFSFAAEPAQDYTP